MDKLHQDWRPWFLSLPCLYACANSVPSYGKLTGSFRSVTRVTGMFTILQFHQCNCRDSVQIVTPFIAGQNLPDENLYLGTVAIVTARSLPRAVHCFAGRAILYFITKFCMNCCCFETAYHGTLSRSLHGLFCRFLTTLLSSSWDSLLTYLLCRFCNFY